MGTDLECQSSGGLGGFADSLELFDSFDEVSNPLDDCQAIRDGVTLPGLRNYSLGQISIHLTQVVSGLLLRLTYKYDVLQVATYIGQQPGGAGNLTLEKSEQRIFDVLCRATQNSQTLQYREYIIRAGKAV